VIRISKAEPPWGGQDNADFQIVVKQREASTHSAPSVFVLKSWAVSQIDGDACAVIVSRPRHDGRVLTD